QAPVLLIAALLRLVADRRKAEGLFSRAPNVITECFRLPDYGNGDRAQAPQNAPIRMGPGPGASARRAAYFSQRYLRGQPVCQRRRRRGPVFIRTKPAASNDLPFAGRRWNPIAPVVQSARRHGRR